MGCKELFVEHTYQGRFLKGLKLKSSHQKLLIGSGQKSQLRLMGSDVSGVHAIIEHSAEGWKIYDLGSATGTLVDGKSVTEHSLNGTTSVQVGEHILKFTPRDEVSPLYSKKQKVEAGGFSAQEVVLVYKGRVTQTRVLGLTERFKYQINGQEVDLAPAKDGEWLSTNYEALEVRQRLVTMPDSVEKDTVTFDRDLGRSFILTLVIAGILLPLLGLLRGTKDETKPAPSKMTQMIYDAKVIQKKRDKAQQVKTRMAGTNNAVNEATKKPAEGQMRVGKVTVATKAISNIKASGLSQLIGKIAVRAGNTSTMVTSTGSVETNDMARGVVAGSTIKGKFENQSGSGFKVSNVGTGGKAGGAKGYADGADLAVGSVGSGEVGMLEEESLVDGGLDREVIASVIKEALGEIRYCYERHLSANPNLMGKVQIKFTIGSVGTVTQQAIGSTTLNNAMVEGCILRRVARWKFPTPKGGTSVIVTYPFLFKSLN